MCRGPDVWGHGGRLCPGPAARQKGQEHTKPAVGLTSALARLASRQLQQLLRVGLLWGFRGPGTWLGWAAGPSGSLRATRNTYVTVSEGRLDDEAKDKRSAPHAGLGGPGCHLLARPGTGTFSYPSLPAAPRGVVRLEEQRSGASSPQHGRPSVRCLAHRAHSRA